MHLHILPIHSYARKQLYPCFENQCTYDSSGHNAENSNDETNVLKHNSHHSVKQVSKQTENTYNMLSSNDL